MNKPSTRSVKCFDKVGFYNTVYDVWGDADNPNVLVCVHGLTRNRHDFWDLAETLSKEMKVITIDIVGRGDSDWLHDPSRYDYDHYLYDVNTVLQAEKVEKTAWLGTSMGGIMGYRMAARKDSIISKLIINDIGAEVSKEVIDYVGQLAVPGRTYESLLEVETFMRERYAAFGKLNDKQWKAMAIHNTRQLDDGKLGLNYDYLIVQGLVDCHTDGIDDWDYWDKVDCDVLLIRGAHSVFFTPDIAKRMISRGPRHRSTFWQIPETGHAPALMEPDQIERIRKWLLKAS